MQTPLDKSITTLVQIPYTISFVIRKRIQVDNFNELPKEKRPPEMMLWSGTAEDLDEWLDKVYKRKQEKETEKEIEISFDEIE